MMRWAVGCRDPCSGFRHDVKDLQPEALSLIIVKTMDLRHSQGHAGTGQEQRLATGPGPDLGCQPPEWVPGLRAQGAVCVLHNVCLSLGLEGSGWSQCPNFSLCPAPVCSACPSVEFVRKQLWSCRRILEQATSCRSRVGQCHCRRVAAKASKFDANVLDACVLRNSMSLTSIGHAQSLEPQYPALLASAFAAPV